MSIIFVEKQEPSELRIYLCAFKLVLKSQKYVPVGTERLFIGRRRRRMNCNQSLFIVITFDRLFILFVILRCTIIHNGCDADYSLRSRFTSVSNFLYIDELYLRLRNNCEYVIIANTRWVAMNFFSKISNFSSNSILASPPREDICDTRIRQFDCEEITGSDYFDRRGETPFDVNNKFLRKKLKKLHRAIFDKLFEKRKSYYLRGGYKYKNPYENQYFEVSGFISGEYRRNITVREDVFICVTIGSHVDTMFHYYVSKVYNVNGEEDHSANCTINGRFIFSYNARRLVALAEEPSMAIVRPDFDVERYYLKIRERRHPSENYAR